MEFISSIYKLLKEIDERGNYLEERLLLLRAILDYVPVAIIAADSEGKINIFNRAAEALVGYRQIDIYLNHISSLYWGNYYEKIQEKLFFNEKLEEKTALIDREGNKLSLHAIIFKLNQKSGTIGFYTQSREESEEVYHALLQNTLFGIYIQQEGRIVYANRIGEELLGYVNGELVDKYLVDIMHPDNELMINKKETIWGKDKQSKSKHEVKLLTKNGDVRHIELTAAPIIYRGNTAVLSTALDVTERRKAEEALCESEEKYRGVIKSSVEGIYRATIEGEFLEVNNAFLTIFGYDTFKEFKMASKNVLKLYFNVIDREKFLSKLKKKGAVKNHEITYKKRDGEIIIVNESAWLIKKNGKQIIEGIIHDITQRKKAEEEAAFYNSVLRHDLGNKNQVILGYLELLQKKELGKKEKELLQKALDAVQKSNELIVKVRLMHQMNDEEKIRSIDIDKAIKKVIRTYREEARMNGMTLRYKKSEIKVWAGTFFEEMVVNIIENAINHSKGSTLDIYSRNEGDFCVISLEDDGVGISDSMKKIVFDKKIKGKRSKGSGLGLYIVKKLAKKYGGTVKVCNGRKKGTRFDIYLPKKV